VESKDRVNILMVDDQPGKLLTYEAILAGLGENLIKAASGREALEHLLRSDIAVMLMDVSMPEMSGFEVADMVRQHPRFQQTAIIFISAVHLTDLDRLKGYDRGGVDYISVPVVPELLRAKVSVFAELHRKTRQLETAEESLRLLSGHLMRTQDNERRRLARDLHDGLGQSLVAMKMEIERSLHTLNATCPGGEGVTEILSGVAKRIDTAIAETRTMSYLLHPPLLDEIGLESALTWYIAGFTQRSNIAVGLDISKAMGRLDHETELTLFRVVQECLVNVHRHSGSPTARVYVGRDGEHVRLEVCDSGKGMSPKLARMGREHSALGVGLQGMQERVRQLHGRMEIISQPGQGTAVIVILPYNLPTGAASSDARVSSGMCSSGV
jgi:signal transduction histidine kinase